MAGRSLGDLVVRVIGDNSDLDRSIDQSKSKLDSFAQKAQKVGSSLSKFVTLPILAIGAAALKSAADMEMQEAAFETLLGSAEAARNMLQELTDFSAKTPFQLTDLAQATKTMLSFGIAQEKIMPNLQALGDIAQGDSEKLKSLTLAFSQIQSTGRLMGQDLLQLINAGFNPLQEISVKTGESMAELKDRMSAGAISAQEISDAFISATSEGGRFYGGMEKASQTLSGQLSTLKDNVAIFGREIVSVLLPVIKDVVSKATEWVQKFQGMDEQTKKTILTVAGIAAAVGPALLAINKIITVVKTLKTTLTALSGPTGLLTLFVAGIVTLAVKAGTAKSAIELEAEAIREKRDALEESNERQKTAIELEDRYINQSELALQIERARLEQERSNAAARNQKLIALRRESDELIGIAIYDAKKIAESESLKEEFRRRGIKTTSEGIKLFKEQIALEQEQAEAIALGNFERVKSIDAVLDQIKASRDLKITTDETSNAIGDETDNIEELESALLDVSGTPAPLDITAIEQVNLGLIGMVEQTVLFAQETKNAANIQENSTVNIIDLLTLQSNKQREVIENYKMIGALISGYINPILMEMGNQLVQEGFNWKDVGIIAIESIAQIIKALAEQAAVQAAIALAEGRLVAAGLWGAASVAGFVAAGAVSGYAQNLREQQTQEASAAAAESSGSASISETVSSAVDTSQAVATTEAENMIHLQIDMDSRPFLDKVFPATKNGTVLISARAVV